MYNIIKNVITSQRFELSDMLRKIDTLWLQSQITDAQKVELEALAREKADPAMSLTLLTRVEALEADMQKLKQAQAGGGAAQPGGGWPEFEPNHVYVKGDKVTYNGKHYTCVLNDYTDRTTWGPGDYPAYWQVS